MIKRIHSIALTFLHYLIIMLCAFFLNGCSRSDLVGNEAVSTITLISATSIDSKGGIMPLADGLQLGLTTEDDTEYNLLSINEPYTLKNGYLQPNGTEIYLPEELSDVALYAYAPYVAYDNIREYLGRVYIPYQAELDQRSKGTASSDLMYSLSRFIGKGKENKIQFAHQCSKLKFKLTSESGADLSNAELSVVNVYYSGELKLNDLEFKVSTGDGSEKKTITAFRNDDGTFEAIIPPQEIPTKSFFVNVKNNDKIYIFETKAAQKLRAGMEYIYELKVKDLGELPFEAKIVYKNVPMPNSLNVSAVGETGDITMTEIPLAGETVSYTNLSIRNADGSQCWARINNYNTVSYSNVIYDGIRYTNLIIEENLGAERSMTLEFYNTKMPKFVHKSVKITQAAASEYLNLSKSLLQVDKWDTKYDFPDKLIVTSNKNWKIENNTDWITVQGYTSGQRNQTLFINVNQNTTGSTRTGKLTFIGEGGVTKEYKVEQTATENPTFTLKYELNLDYRTVDDRFKAYRELIGTYYAGKIIIFAKYVPNEDAAASINNESQYGFLVDAPTSFNHLVVNGFRSDYFIYKGYSGSSTTLNDIVSSIHSAESKTSQNFYRRIIFNLPIPANVKRNQMVKYTVKITNILDTEKHDPAEVTYTIIEQ